MKQIFNSLFFFFFFLTPFNCLCTFVKNHLTLHVCVYFWAVYSVHSFLCPLFYQYCIVLIYRSFVSKMCIMSPPTWVFSFKKILSLLVLLFLTYIYNFLELASSFLDISKKKVCLDFDRNCNEYIDQIEENWHQNNIFF